LKIPVQILEHPAFFRMTRLLFYFEDVLMLINRFRFKGLYKRKISLFNPERQNNGIIKQNFY